MLGKTILVLVILGSVSSEPIRRSIIMPNDIITSVFTDYVEQLESSIRPETLKSVRNFIDSAIGLKLSALEIAVRIGSWLSSNLVSIAIGSVLALGICKITGKCSLSYDGTFSKLYSFITTDQLESAQNLFINAMRSYEQGENENEQEEKVYEEEKEERGDLSEASNN